ncbi:MAG TPA: glucose-6-phosphate dehydrogenase assembly protein OpcA [Verrucomicrobiae bacterium]|nr:glucose-6-phosphate dehydrogenase assembly protein OpcA [Verrucomicrobiae bacterium]
MSAVDVPSAVASTMTFIAYVDDPAIVTWMHERTRAIVEKHPARLVLLDGTLDQGSHQTHAVARTEWVLLGTRGLSPEQLRSIAHAFTRTGVPTVLLWAGHRILDDPIFPALNATVDSLILDSSRIAPGVAQLAELAEYFAQEPRLAVQDLAYLRLTPWQEMIAQFFDEPEFADELQALEHVIIAAGSQAEAYYLLCWLASRLEWSPSGAHQLKNRQGKPITFAFQPEGGPRRVRSVELRSQTSTFRAQLEDDDATVCLSVDGAKKRAMRCEPLHDIAIVDLLERAILEPQTSDVYRATVEMVRALLAKTGAS